jgi:hypothetical protein
MKIFISWSGMRGGTLAAALEKWLPKVIPDLDLPFLSSRIKAGKQWQDEIAEGLRNCHAGLVCLTPESLDSHWLHFEVGALVSRVERRVFPYAHRVPPERLKGPLNGFQSKPTTREGTWELVQAIADASKSSGLADGTLQATFDEGWPDLARVISNLSHVTIEPAIEHFPELFNTQTFEEPMPACYDFNWIARHKRLAGIEALLVRERSRVEALGEEHLLYLYDELVSACRSYMTNLVPVLLAAKESRPARVDELSDDVIRSCEEPRKRVRELKERLLDARGRPVLAEAVRFEKAELATRKHIAYDFESRIKAGDTILSDADRRDALNSYWPLDRIVAYQTLAATASTRNEVLDVVSVVDREYARTKADGQASLMPLHCALHALDDSMRRLSDPSDRDAVRPHLGGVVERTEAYVKVGPDRHYRGEMTDRLRGMRAWLESLTAK